MTSNNGNCMLNSQWNHFVDTLRNRLVSTLNIGSRLSLNKIPLSIDCTIFRQPHLNHNLDTHYFGCCTFGIYLGWLNKVQFSITSNMSCQRTKCILEAQYCTKCKYSQPDNNLVNSSSKYWKRYTSDNRSLQRSIYCIYCFLCLCNILFGKMCMQRCYYKTCIQPLQICKDCKSQS